MTQSRSAATKRLLRDLREWKSCSHQASCITAAPLEKNIFEWHVNFIPHEGPLKDIIFHLVMRFPDNYPLHHPYVTLKNYLHHPNVFVSGEFGHHTQCGSGYWVCLDMIKCSNWSAAYSVSSILMQLLSFLITTRAPQDYGPDKMITHSKSEIDEMRLQSMQFQCDGCHHTFSKPFPVRYTPKPSLPIHTKHHPLDVESTRKGINYWSKYMHRDVETIVMDFLTISELLFLSRVNSCMKTLVSQSKSVRMAQFSCWYNKIDLRYSQYVRNKTHIRMNDPVSATLVLGYGINPTFYENTSMHRQFTTYINDTHKGLEFPMLLQCETTFDLLSKYAFEIGGIRRTPMNDKQFTHWIPMYIVHGGYHGMESLKALKQYTLKVYQAANVSISAYHPFMSIHLICSIMSSLVVQLMRAITSNKLHHSINVLEAYFHFYHLLLAVYHHPTYYDILHPIIQKKCVDFIVNAQQRSKQCVPNLGNFMMWFTLCDNISCIHIFEALLEETLIRNQRWVIKKYGDSYEHKDAKHFEIHRAFLGSRVSKRLFMFQYFFMKKIAGLGVVLPAQKFKALNESLGCVDPLVSLRLQTFCKALDKITDFETFFGVIEMKYPGDETMKRWLRKAVDISAERRYHTPSVRIQIRLRERGDKDNELAMDKAFESFDYALFFEAVHNNDTDAVRKLLGVTDTDGDNNNNNNNTGIDSMDIDNVDWSAIRTDSCLITTDDKEIIFDQHMTNSKRDSPVFIAANNCNIKMVQLLISNGFDVDIANKQGYTADPSIAQLIKKHQNAVNGSTVKRGFCAAQYIHIAGLPPTCSKENVKWMFKRYGFSANIADSGISFKKDHVLVKIREHKIGDKIENMRRCFCFGYKIKAKVCELKEPVNNSVISMPAQASTAPASSRSRFPPPIRKSSGPQNGYQSSRYRSRYNGYSHRDGTSYKAASSRYSRNGY